MRGGLPDPGASNERRRHRRTVTGSGAGSQDAEVATPTALIRAGAHLPAHLAQRARTRLERAPRGETGAPDHRWATSGRPEAEERRTPPRVERAGLAHPSRECDVAPPTPRSAPTEAWEAPRSLAPPRCLRSARARTTALRRGGSPPPRDRCERCRRPGDGNGRSRSPRVPRARVGAGRGPASRRRWHAPPRPAAVRPPGTSLRPGRTPGRRPPPPRSRASARDDPGAPARRR